MMNPTTSKLIFVANANEKRFPKGSKVAVWDSYDSGGFTGLINSSDGEWPLPSLTEYEKKGLLNNYYGAISSIGTENGKRSLWWYTWTASRDRFLSTILDDMEMSARVEKACEQGLPGNLIILCPDPYLATALISIAKRKGVHHVVSLGDRASWIKRWARMRIRPIYSGFKTCQRALAQKKKRPRDVGLVSIRRSPSEKLSLIVTWLKPHNLTKQGPITDTYFGRLPELIKNDSQRAILFGDLLDSPNNLPMPDPTQETQDALAASEFYTFRNIFSALHMGLRASIKIPDCIKTGNPELYPLIKRDIYNNKGAIVYGLLFESSLRRACQEIKPSKIIHCCENNPWEKSCVWAAESISPKPDVLGFMHCAVLLSHPKIIITEPEKSVRPRPRKLICTGPKAREIMVEYGGHSSEELVAGSALRHEYLWQMNRSNRRTGSILNILIALDGLPTMPGFVRFVHEALDGIENHHTFLRPHPIDTVERVVSDAGFDLSEFKTLVFSQHNSIAQDLKKADVVIYKGSTLAIEAGYLGIPLIHVNLNSLLNNDPLFEVEHLKQIVSTPEELVKAVNLASTMSESIYEKERKLLRNYIDGYFVKPTKTNNTIFLSDLRSEHGVCIR